jgi:hypothetical protein
MNKHIEFIRAIQTLLDGQPDMPKDKKQALEAAIASLKKDRWMEALYKLSPLLGQIGQAIIKHEHW